LDIIIYDDIDNSPILLEGDVGLFPIECVYAFVEVKSKLTTDEIKKTARSIADVRRLARDKLYAGYSVIERAPGKPEVLPTTITNPLPPRSYVLALRSSISDKHALATAQAATTSHEAHIHGMAALDKDWFVSQRAWTVPYKFDHFAGKAFARFSHSVLRGVQSFPMRPADMTRYLGLAEP
jgi:hypothetical protein